MSAFFVQSQCGTDTICIIPDGVTLKIDGNLNVGALIVRGVLEWTISTQSSSDQFLCGGYVVVENSGSFEMDLNSSTSNKKGWIYIKNNGAVHPELRSRSFGTSKQRYSSDNPTMEIRGRELSRTWSLLSEPLYPGMNTMKLLHDPAQMGWKVGDRLGISPTESTARGWGQDVRIVDIQNDGTITLNENINNYHRADFEIGNDAVANAPPALLSAEIVNLSRNIIITGDDFEEVQCDPNLPEAVGGEQTSVLGCRCATFRNKCHVGLHTMQKFGGVTKIINIRVEKCGQRGTSRLLLLMLLYCLLILLSAILFVSNFLQHVSSIFLQASKESIACISTKWKIVPIASSKEMLSKILNNVESSFTVPITPVSKTTSCTMFAVPMFIWKTATKCGILWLTTSRSAPFLFPTTCITDALFQEHPTGLPIRPTTNLDSFLVLAQTIISETEPRTISTECS